MLKMKNNPKEKFCEAFRSLLSERMFEKITVEDITVRAGLSRSTFYRYFMDKYDIMVQTGFYMDPLPNADYYLGSSVYKKYLEKSCLRLLEFRDYYENIKTVVGQNSFWDAFYETGVETFIKFITGNGKKQISDKEKVAVEIYISGTTWYAWHWIANGFTPSYKVVAEALFDSIPDSIKKYFSES